MKEQFIHIDEHGNKFYYSDKSIAVRLRHREDGPAIEWADGSKVWFINGNYHREDGPAIEDADGYKSWYIDGKKLTEEQFNDRNKVEAIRNSDIIKEMRKQYIEIDESGDKFYYSDKEMTVLHREDGPAIEWAIGSNVWYINGKRHREDGPAVEAASGYKIWLINGNKHREDGPAYEDASGYKEWWINGAELTEEGFNDRNNVEFTLDEIAEKLGVSVDRLKIKK